MGQTAAYRSGAPRASFSRSFPGPPLLAPAPWPRLTSVGVVQEAELTPVVVVEQRQQRPPQGRPQLQRELTLALAGETGCDQRDVQGAAEGRQRVDRALVVQAEDGEDAAGVLGTNWERDTDNGGEVKGRLASDVVPPRLKVPVPPVQPVLVQTCSWSIQSQSSSDPEAASAGLTLHCIYRSEHTHTLVHTPSETH